jgi:prepilin-type N-terminal cleavage/methylation domain-containing protein/prepilin-type processing-associated H-X9-DG protein
MALAETRRNRGIKKSRQPGFTLVELLAVLLIVGVLGSLLLGGVHRCFAYSKQISCINNLKQIHGAMMSYPADHNGFLPPYSEVVAGKPNYYWTSKLRPYLNQPSKGDFWDNEPAPSKLYRCPADTRNPGDSFQSAYGTGALSKYGASGLCGLNGLIWGVWAYDDGVIKNWKAGFPLAVVPKPSQTAMIFDHDQLFASGPMQLGSSVYAFRHDNKINVIFFDGHVGTVSRDQIPESSSPFWGEY